MRKKSIEPKLNGMNHVITSSSCLTGPKIMACVPRQRWVSLLFYVVELRMTRLRMLSNRYSLMYYKIIVLFLMNTYLSRLTWYAKELFNNEHHFPNGPRTFSNSSPNQKCRARKNRKLVVRAKQTTFYIKYKINIYGFSSPLLRSQNFKVHWVL